ncbi:MAG: phosphoribosylformylglycinamidine synthase subunit PurS [Bacteroidales bacterium]|nr:phosphoribosylformylglycinamidine synthase subunit PurS [Bacteroidales bacterium]
MKFLVEIDVMPLKALLDPQGKAVTNTLHNMGHSTAENVRIGKHITMDLEAEDMMIAEEKTEEICKKVLSNPIMESFQYKINKA